ncbi:serine/threonine-protein kinase [Hyalangium rubrum]|uniref:non-specific serine/threonine protein kinase n=1 Tax=Hyalangium rubrum TaxID=3103134 RepID=A0ABU5H2T2_9BACT|nr:serine/threonine-protein kinase [Hyalangium sp. s54d21]MDY7227749.1 serine/threonine-protein kinase [Hyalangium sp. s54d21]
MATQRTFLAWEPGCLPPGVEIGAWRVLELRGKGAYGAVYRVEPVGESGAEPCALKLALHPVDPRFEREVELLTRLRHHPNVPHLRERGLWAHPVGLFPFIVMEWVQGVPLYDWAQARTRSSRQVLRVLAQVARALEATHGVDGVHRDVKGANILVGPEDDRARLLDFGAGDFQGAPTLTREVLPPGTPRYRSPEAQRFQWLYWRQRGAHYEPGPADDVYALGVTAYRLVTGSYPPPGVDPEAAVGGTLVPSPGWVPPEEVVTVCPELAGLIRRMLSEEPSTRGSAAELAQALEEAAKTAGRAADLPLTQRSTRTTASRRPTSAWLAACVVAVVCVSGWWTSRQQPVGEVTRDGGVEDASTSDLAKDALTVSAHVKQPESTWDVLALEMPEKPMPGQARPPCKKHELEINGGCWVEPKESKPPCREREHEWKGVCYYAVLALPLPATSQPKSPGKR